ncbi:MAG: ATP-binding protein [Succinivibrionaceae bacterium]|nr:ATP-binding protein [Succinivibrionaceae bacterium]MEE1340984.1 ATP-binding protein [Succinivibrionaceae bacterium]
MTLFKRENYLKQIRGFYHSTDIIKVITGIRRCGKSSLMQTIADELIDLGISPQNIVYLNLDKRGFRSIRTQEKLENLIDESSKASGIKYLFIDEIQNVEGFEEVINEFREDGDYSIFITGSNSYLLSGELVTKLTGRYLEFEMYPLTFDEYLGMKSFLNIKVENDIASEFEKFITEGGFPETLYFQNLEDKRKYVSGIVQEIFEKDIRKRVRIKNVAVFNDVQKYIINNFGATTSLLNMLSDLHNAGGDIKRETLNRYIQVLIDAKILYKCERFDLKSRKLIGGKEKYYLADLGFYFAMNTDNRINYGPVLENIVYIYARAKGYAVSVGRIGKLECDFILRKLMNYSYVQVAMTILSDRKTEEREYRPLESIRDNYPKYVITRNDLIQQRNGITHVNIGTFMKDSTLF